MVKIGDICQSSNDKDQTAWKLFRIIDNNHGHFGYNYTGRDGRYSMVEYYFNVAVPTGIVFIISEV